MGSRTELFPLHSCFEKIYIFDKIKSFSDEVLISKVEELKNIDDVMQNGKLKETNIKIFRGTSLQKIGYNRSIQSFYDMMRVKKYNEEDNEDSKNEADSTNRGRGKGNKFGEFVDEQKQV